MRIIQKKISLEEFVSRLPSVVPSYKDNLEELYYFDDESIKDREYLYTSDYGMVPVNLSISGFDDYNFKLVGFNDECETDGRVYSFHSISNLYHFFKEYYNLLNGGHCNMVYSSATEYYEYESVNTTYSHQMPYGNDINTYIEMDDKFSFHGGKTSFVEVEGVVVEAKDEGFYKWICENLIPTYEIPRNYRDHWNRDRLYYPDVIKWIAWFKERDEIYSSITYAECVEQKDCCDCKEYFERGGKDICDSMVEWYNGIQGRITELNSYVEENIECLKPTFVQSLSLYTSLESIGEFSILSDEYELGKDYRVADGYASANTKSGTTVVKDDKSLILSGDSGFCFDRKLMEKVFKEEDWGSYTELYKSENAGEFSANTEFYAYSNDNVMIVGMTEEEVSDQFKDVYPITFVDAIVIDGNIYEINVAESGETTYGKCYIVYRDKLLRTPYTNVNGKTYYAELEMNGEEPYYYFTIFKKGLEYGRERGNNLVNYIDYNGATYIVSESGLTIDDSEYMRINGYAYDNNGVPYYISRNGTVYYTNNFLTPPTSAIVNGDVLDVVWDYEPTIYHAYEVIGTTASKITDLMSRNLLVDDIGNEIEALYDMGVRYNYQPNENEVLEPIYQVGNVSSIVPYVNTNTDQNNIEGTINYFVGDIITKMVFYYKTSDGLVGESTKVVCEINGDGDVLINGVIASGYTSLSAITKSTSGKTSGVTYDEDIYCDITYYKGATLYRKEGKRFTIAYGNVSGYSYGVEYKECVNFVKENAEYYLKMKNSDSIPMFRNDVGNHSVSYPVCIYKLKQHLTTIDSSLYGTRYDVALADFKSEINLRNASGETYSVYSSDLTPKEEVYPIFMEEYRIGTTSKQNIDSDIYIDRGINSAFEKHIKIGEITSLEALEQYGLNYFKIMEN